MAAPRKSAARKTPEPEAVAGTPGGIFARLADEAATRSKPEKPDYILGKDEGFDPPLVITRPKIKRQEAIYRAERSNDAFAGLRAFVGDDYDRIVGVLDKIDRGDAILGQLVLDLMKHFYGKGVNEVPGGSAAS